MILYSISQLGRFSGLKPHTIRAWESRYNALRPERSTGNTRYYNTSQLKRLMNLAGLVKAGYRASEVASLTDEKLCKMIDSILDISTDQTEEYFIFQLIAAGMTYDEARFERIFNHCLKRYRLKNTYQYILLPMLERIGLLWKCDKLSPAQEHFVSNFIRRKLFASADALPPAKPGANTWLLFLPENEVHELGLLLAFNLIRLSGEQVIYLGANVPFDSLYPAISEIQPDYLMLFSTQECPSKSVQGFLRSVVSVFHGKKIYLAGNGHATETIPTSANTQWLSTVESLTKALSIA